MLRSLYYAVVVVVVVVLASSPPPVGRWVRILAPLNGTQLIGPLIQIKLDSHADVTSCVQFTNKRVSWESYTHCANSKEWSLDGFLPGVWRALAYATNSDASHSSRGPAQIEGTVDESWFLVDGDEWRRSTSGEGAATVLARSRMTWDVGGRLRDFAGESRSLVVSMANTPHVDLALNMAYSAIRAGTPPFVVFTTSEEARAAVASAGVFTLLLPSCDTVLESHRDVQTAGFADIAILKPLCVLAVLEAGLDALWVDTDVVFLRDPLELLQRLGNYELVIQAGGMDQFDAPDGPERNFHVEACTGVFAARNATALKELLKTTIYTLAFWTDSGDSRYLGLGDQAATNLALFEQRFLAPVADAGGVRVDIIPPLLAPGGGLFFEGPRSEDGGLAALVLADPILAHNNFIVGKAQKVRRFEDRAMWFAKNDASNFRERLHGSCPLSVGACSTLCSAANVVIGGARPARRLLGEEQEDGVELFMADRSLCALAERVVAVGSIGRRPWAETLMRRVANYVGRIGGTDLLSLRKADCDGHKATIADFNEGFTTEGGGNEEALHSARSFDSCAKRLKLVVIRDCLRSYRRLLLLDDTALVRGDTPDLFSLVPAFAVGATVEGARVRPRADARDRLSLASRRFFGDKKADDGGVWFNSGVLVLSWVHAPLVSALPETLEAPVDDQWFLNAVTRRHMSTPIFDLGDAYNYLGSFETSNRASRPFEAAEAFVVHGTTGLLMDATDRAAYLTNISDHWARRGL